MRTLIMGTLVLVALVTTRDFLTFGGISASCLFFGVWDKVKGISLPHGPQMAKTKNGF